ncbi:MAG: terminase small subunit [Clostridiales bacterium]
MTQRQKKFCENYLKTNNKKEAALAAGYSEKNANSCGSRLLKITEIKEYISGKTTKTMDKIACNEEILEYLTNVLRSTDESVVVRDKMRAAELLGKNQSLFTDSGSVEKPMVVFYGEDKILD